MEESPFERRKIAVIDLTPGDRISIARRKGTFIGYWRIKNFPNVIEWMPDGTLAVEVTTWTGGGIMVSSWDESDGLSDIEAWEAEFSE